MRRGCDGSGHTDSHVLDSIEAPLSSNASSYSTLCRDGGGLDYTDLIASPPQWIHNIELLFIARCQNSTPVVTYSPASERGPSLRAAAFRPSRDPKVAP